VLGNETLRAAYVADDVTDARERVVDGLNNSGSIIVGFQWKGKGVVTYSNRQHEQSHECLLGI